MNKGSLHPITQFLREVLKHFESLGFEIFETPEVETEWYNFDALNVPADHPSRDVQDTFWLSDGRVLRTHTSSGQLHATEQKKLPIRVVMPGRCYRNEATDQTHEATFYQLDCLYIDKDVKVGHLFWTLSELFKNIYGNDTKVRFRPHHYPFVEPGFDVDMYTNGKWVEMLGSGMVHPKVIKNMGLDPDKYSGFAFGLGIDRLCMKKYGIEDIRNLYNMDLRFLKQF